jgi:hypothetical protein
MHGFSSPAVSEAAVCAEYEEFGRRRGTLLAENAHSARMRTGQAFDASGYFGRCAVVALGPDRGSR